MGCRSRSLKLTFRFDFQIYYTGFSFFIEPLEREPVFGEMIQKVTISPVCEVVGTISNKRANRFRCTTGHSDL